MPKYICSICEIANDPVEYSMRQIGLRWYHNICIEKVVSFILKRFEIGIDSSFKVTKFQPADQDELIERLSAIEHEQWVEWSQSIANSEMISDDRLTRWEKLWRDYSSLTEEEKDQDRKYAKKVIDQLGFF